MDDILICSFSPPPRLTGGIPVGRPHRQPAKRAFSLIELLSVLAIIGILAAAAGPAIRGLAGSGDINRSISNLSGYLELARTYAMTHHTYVRVAFSELPTSASRMSPGIGVLVIYSSDGTLDSDSASDMADPSKWPEASKSLILENLGVDDSLNANMALTAQDALPSASDISTFSRRIGGITSTEFSSFVQFSPTGEARVLKGEPARFIKLGMDRPAPQNGKNPFLLRLSGINGTINVFRKEDL